MTTEVLGQTNLHVGEIVTYVQYEATRIVCPLLLFVVCMEKHNFDDKASAFHSILTRLESVSCKLEETVQTINSTSSSKPTVDTSTQVTPVSSSTPLTSPIPLTMSVAAFADIVTGPLASYIALSNKIGGDVAAHAKLVSEAFQAQQQFLTVASQSKDPGSGDKMRLLQPTSDKISAIQALREKNRASPFFNHLSAISESIPALGWVTVASTPAPYVKEMNDAGQFYTNRVLKEWKEKNKTHVDWTKAWIETLTELQKFIRQHHTTGLVWSGTGTVAAPPPPPPGGMPPPPPVLDLSAMSLDTGANDRSALFAEINQGANITKNLKRVTGDMQTHKNPNLKASGPTPASHNAVTSPGRPAAPISKPPVFARDGKKWLVEYQKDNSNLVVEGAEMNNVVYMFNCINSTLVVKGKVNSVFMDSCKKSSVVFDSLVSSIEFVNCQSVQMQVLGKVPTISIDKTDGCQMYLSPESLEVEIVSSKSSEMNVLIPKGNGDYTEHPIPEQFKTTVAKGGLKTIVIESKG
uniref:Adenylyl cyclase-associated protein 1 n=1 Tax=Cacopsylla melanoneura TaxID=428564 RepID=A0A8D9A3M3_9HEMI